MTWRIYAAAVPLLIVAVLGSGPAAIAGRLTDSGRQALAGVGDRDFVRVIVVMAEDTHPTLAASLPNHVGANLQALALRSQRMLFAELNRLQGLAAIREATRLPIINAVALTATKAAVLEIVTRPDVAYVGADGVRTILPMGHVTGRPMGILNGVPWAIAHIKADQAWANYGYRGEGIVIGVLDTGVVPTIAALSPNYRGGTNSFFDAVNGLTDPYDDHGHGTATAGNCCGNDPANSFYGTAPNAKFISAKGFDSGGSGADSDLLDCAAWMLDPDGSPATDDKPDVVNNSWGGGHADSWYQSAVDAWVAADIYPVFAIGNTGSGASTSNSPGDYLNVIGVGATDSSDNIASFSSRGPVNWSGTDYIKPDVSAPGSVVNVPLRNGTYGTASGTSFACPHTAGAVALLRQAKPAATNDEVKQMLKDTAVDRGTAGPDNDYGWGLIDVNAAVGQAVTGPPVLSFLGTPNYLNDGVDPDNGAAGDLFEFKVRLTDTDNDEPDWVQLLLIRDKVLWETVSMVGNSTETKDGRIYRCKRALPSGDWSYKFAAQDADGAASGPPTDVVLGPIMKNGPFLTYGYHNDGVAPNRGTADVTQFDFKAMYWDYDGDPATSMGVQLRRDGVVYGTFNMHVASGTDPATGILYKWTHKLPAGTFEYRFIAADVDGAARGTPTRWANRPLVLLGPGSLAIGGLAAVPTRAGAEVVFSLTAAAKVEAQVLNVAGRPIRTITTSTECAAGRNTLVWDARSDAGLRVAAGTYLVQVIARDASGTQSRAVTAVSVRP
jgi:Subtilase family/FlgD Ig-like domain